MSESMGQIIGTSCDNCEGLGANDSMDVISPDNFTTSSNIEVEPNSMDADNVVAFENEIDNLMNQQIEQTEQDDCEIIFSDRDIQKAIVESNQEYEFMGNMTEEAAMELALQVSMAEVQSV
jgi:hypothetical protein